MDPASGVGMEDLPSLAENLCGFGAKLGDL